MCRALFAVAAAGNSLTETIRIRSVRSLRPRCGLRSMSTFSKIKLIALAMLTLFVGIAKSPAARGSAPNDAKIAVAKLLPTTSPDWDIDTSGPLCGVYAACTALKMLCFDAEPRDFIAARYIGKCGGSTPEEVASIIEDCGAKAQIVSRLSSFDLRQVDCPVIANVRSNANSKRFDHWVVVVKDEDAFLVFDGPKQKAKLRPAEFLAMWSGLGILVSAKSDNPLMSVWLGRLAVMQLVLIGCGVTTSVSATRINLRSCKMPTQFLFIILGSLVFACLGSALVADLANYSHGLAVATAAHSDHGYRHGTLDDATQASSDPTKLLVDARLEQDYQRGSISKAVNIPVNASPWSIRDYLQNLSRETPIVIFCQSAACGYDESVAENLVALGFHDVTVCNQGWAEYKSSRGPKLIANEN